MDGIEIRSAADCTHKGHLVAVRLRYSGYCYKTCWLPKMVVGRLEGSWEDKCQAIFVRTAALGHPLEGNTRQLVMLCLAAPRSGWLDGRIVPFPEQAPSMYNPMVGWPTIMNRGTEREEIWNDWLEDVIGLSSVCELSIVFGEWVRILRVSEY